MSSPDRFYRKVLDHGYVRLRNVAGPTRRPDRPFDADDVDPANAARMSFNASDNSERPREADLRLNDYLIQHYHNTPLQMVETWWEMQMPIFVARQFVRHRTATINEISARYVQLPAKWYIPDPCLVGTKSPTNKQGRTVDLNAAPTEAALLFCERLNAQCQESYRMYEEAIREGVPNELARCFLHLNTYTKWLWKMDLHNIVHFMALRLHEHAQYEAQAYASAIYELLSEVLPDLMASFRGHRLPV